MKNIVNIALKIAKKAHEGKFRHDGKTPYITHPIAVAERMKKYHTKFNKNTLVALALLHDVCEDSDITEDDLKDQGIPGDIILSLIYLTRYQGQDYLDYILEIKEEDTMARLVKIADIKHNLSTLDPKKKSAER